MTQVLKSARQTWVTLKEVPIFCWLGCIWDTSILGIAIKIDLDKSRHIEQSGRPGCKGPRNQVS